MHRDHQTPRTEDDDFRVFLDYLSGIDSIEFLADAHNIPVSAVEMIIDVYLDDALEGSSFSYRTNPRGVRTVKLTQKEKDRIADQYLQDAAVSAKHLAEKYRCETTDIYNILIQKGIDIRKNKRGDRNLKDDTRLITRRHGRDRTRKNPFPKAQRKELQYGVETRKSYPPFDFSKQNADGDDLSALDLRHVNFQGASLVGVDFTDSDLRGANLQGADIRHAKFIDADLRGANLMLAKIEGVIFKNTDLSKANLALIGNIADLVSVFKSCDIDGSIVTDKDFIGLMNFSKEKGSGWLPDEYQHLENIHMSSLSNDLHGVNLSGAYLKGVDLQGANLEGANLENANLQGANLEMAYLVDVNLQGANLQGVKLRFAKMQGANLRGASLQSANLEDANLYFAQLHGASLQNAVLENANLHGAKLDSANLQGANLSYADATGADLQGSDLQAAILKEAILVRANLTNATLQDTYLHDAKYDEYTETNANTLTKAQKDTMIYRHYLHYDINFS